MDKTINRRDFMKLGIFATSGFGFLPFTNGCTTTKKFSSEKLESVYYPKLPGRKLQSPEHYGLRGCYTGIVDLYGPHREYHGVLTELLIREECIYRVIQSRRWQRQRHIPGSGRG